MKNLFLLFCAVTSLLTSLLFFSCSKNREKEIILADSDSLALAVDIEWAVISDPYVTFREEHEWESKETAHGKRGDVLQVKGTSYSTENEKWVKFSEGFLPAKSVKIFSNKFQAENISRGMTE